MAAETLITQELKDLLGKEGEPEYFEVEKGHLKIFAQAIEDPNPLWTDAEYAKKSPYGALIAPPTFLIDAGIIKLGDKLIAIIERSGGGFINGGTVIDYFAPIKVGDTIKTTAKLIDLKEKVGSSGKLLFMILEMNYHNQKGELVRRCRDTFICPRKV
jgi:acyl dehydratase